MSGLLPYALLIKSTTAKQTKISGKSRASCHLDSLQPLDKPLRLSGSSSPLNNHQPLSCMYIPHHPPRSKAALMVYNILSNPGIPRAFCYLSCSSLSLLHTPSHTNQKKKATATIILERMSWPSCLSWGLKGEGEKGGFMANIRTTTWDSQPLLPSHACTGLL